MQIININILLRNGEFILKKSIRTDLAAEARELYFETAAEAERAEEIKGVKTEIKKDGEDITITKVFVDKKDGEKILKKKAGAYVTLEFPKDFAGYNNLTQRLTKLCAAEIKNLIGKKPPKNTLVIGLGNRNITADALGPKTIEGVLATRHLIKYMPEEIDGRISSVSAVSPGVLGLTGIETGEIVFGICEKTKPDLVIAVDALCARKVQRINSTIQISDTGIVPGAGVGNRRMEISRKSLNIPVIAVGIPTVVDAATVASDTFDVILSSLLNNAKENLSLYKILKAVKNEDNEGLISETLYASADNFIVTPKETDEAICRLSKIISDGINLALHNGISLCELESFKF